jgi:N-acetylmuramoyl-L-alanine amidase
MPSLIPYYKLFKLNGGYWMDDLAVMYKIIAGSFKVKENAEERGSYLRSLGIDSVVQAATISNELIYRVQAGAYSNRDLAEKNLKVVYNAGIKDAFIFEENSSEVNVSENEYIMGQIILLPDQMEHFVQIVNPAAIELANFYVDLGNDYGMRGDIAFAQAILETNYFRFTGVVKSHQNNFCGLGSTGPDNPGASFDTPQNGVLAHLQHLFAYAETNPLPNKYPLVDPRFRFVRRGVAPTWVELNGKWAVPGDRYGQTILDIYKRMSESTP